GSFASLLVRCSMISLTLLSTIFPYTTLFRSRSIPAPDPFRTRRAAAGRGASTRSRSFVGRGTRTRWPGGRGQGSGRGTLPVGERSEEHTSELQSRFDLVCCLLLEKQKYEYSQ